MKITAAILFALALAFGQAMQGGAQIPALSIPAFILVTLGAIFAIPGAFRLSAAPLPMAGCLAFFWYVIWRTQQPDVDPFLAHVDVASVLACGVALVAASSGFPDPRSRALLLGATGVVLAIQLGIGLAQFTLGGDWMPAGWFSEELKHLYGDRFVSRTRGSFLNPNHFAWAMGTGCLMALAFAVWGRVAVWLRILLIYFSGVFLVGVIISASRGGMIALGAGLLMFGLMSLIGVAPVVRKGFLSVVVGGVLIVCVVAGAGLFVYQSAWSTQGRFQEMLVPGVRASFAEVAWRSFQTAPVVGTGPGEFLYAARIYRQPTTSGDPMYAHNDWLQLMAEYGWIGISLAAIAFVLLLSNGLQRFSAGLASRLKDGQKPFSNESAVAAGCVSASILFAVHSVVDFNFHIPANALLAALVMGLLAAAPRASYVGRWWRLHRWTARTFTGAGFLTLGGGLIFHLVSTVESDVAVLRAKNALAAGDAPLALAQVESALQKTPLHSELLWLEASAVDGLESAAMLKAIKDLPKPDPAEQMQSLPEDMALDDEMGDPGFEIVDGLSDEERAKNLERSAVAYRKAIALRPKERRFYFGLAHSLNQAGNYAEARKLSLAAIERDYWSGYPLSIYGEILDMQGDRVEALRVFDLGTRMPDNQWAVMGLRRIQAEDEMLRQLENETEPTIP
jgi:O-antigen ligase